MDATALLESFGIDAAVARELVALRTRVTGILDADEPGTSAAAHALQIALLATSDVRRHATALRAITDWIAPTLDELTAYDAGRFWHVRGLLSFRVDGAFSAATRALIASTRALLRDGSPRAQHYLARVHDTFGQLLHNQGLLTDALVELQHSLALRDPADRFGTAITLGNLGRLCMDLGDFPTAADHFSRDLAIVEELAPQLLHVRAQLLSHVGHCRLHAGELAAARDAYEQSRAFADRCSDPLAATFAALGLARVTLRSGDAIRAREAAVELLARMGSLAAPEHVSASVYAAAHELAAEAALALGIGAGDATAPANSSESDREYPAADPRRSGPPDRALVDEAIAEYRRALEYLERTPGSSPMEHVSIHRGLSTALAARGEPAEAARHLRHALRYLDGTAAIDLRRQVEHELQRSSSDSWLLHSAGRFVGQHHIELLLDEAGKPGFRGSTREVVVLFSDIRGFTALAERLPAAGVIELLNDYLTRMTRAIEQHGGAVDKFIGDAVMAVFPFADRLRAIDAALAMFDELERFNRQHPTHPDLAMGVGLHGGEVIAGLIGSPQKRELTVIGDVVNTASRLEGMTKQLGATILVSSALVDDATRARYLLRPLGRFTPKGRTRSLDVFDVAGERDRSAAANAMQSEIARVEAALATLSERRLDDAAREFDALCEHVAGTPRVAGYALLGRRARELATAPLDRNWSGEIRLSEK